MSKLKHIAIAVVLPGLSSIFSEAKASAAIKYRSGFYGCESGAVPTVMVVDEGSANNLSSSSLKDDAVAFIFDRPHLMASPSSENTKISHDKR